MQMVEALLDGVVTIGGVWGFFLFIKHMRNTI